MALEDQRILLAPLTVRNLAGEWEESLSIDADSPGFNFYREKSQMLMKGIKEPIS